MQRILNITTHSLEGLYDITARVENEVKASGIMEGIVNVYVQGATAGIMIQENWDNSVQQDVLSMLKKIIPRGVWLHR